MKQTEETTILLIPQAYDEISCLRDRWDCLKKRIIETKKRINSSIDYFELLEEAKQWFTEGSKFLITVARKAVTVKTSEDANDLSREIDDYLKLGDKRQEKRIEKLKELSTITFGK